MELKEKENYINKILLEMKKPILKENNFTDLLLRMTIKSSDYEEYERTGIVNGFKTIIVDKRKVEKMNVFDERFNNIDLEKTYVKDGFLHIAYDKNRKAIQDINYLNGAFMMKKNDNRIY